jgi:2-amino-4-hydroxy-6-hydroxymethyldihydropteridine diphosphokinase
MAEVAIALGSNLGDRMGWLATALSRLAELLTTLRMSSIYETDPVGDESQPRYLNAVVVGTTELGPVDLLQCLQRIEDDLGRERPYPNAPRTIDLDLLLYDELILATPELTLPHPRLHERFFVLVPLAELAPSWRPIVVSRNAIRRSANFSRRSAHHAASSALRMTWHSMSRLHHGEA